jgi:8-oxo-dGTP pyrophosphatase MutT (NUDIX family)
VHRRGDADLVGPPVSQDEGFAILARGPWTAAQLVVRADGPRHVIPPALEPAVAAAWSAAQRPGVNLFDGPIARLDQWMVVDGSLHLHLGTTGYRAFIGSNAAHPEWVERHGRAAMSDPLGTSAALLAADGHLVFGMRSQQVALYPGRAHPFGGTCDPGCIDVVGELRRELAEEIGLALADCGNPLILALVEDLTLRQPELIVLVTTRLDRTALAARLDAAEHGQLWTVPATATAVRDALADGASLTPVTRAVLAMWLEVA